MYDYPLKEEPVYDENNNLSYKQLTFILDNTDKEELQCDTKKVKQMKN